jgi:hypothetical protein
VRQRQVTVVSWLMVKVMAAAEPEAGAEPAAVQPVQTWRVLNWPLYVGLPAETMTEAPAL